MDTFHAFEREIKQLENKDECPLCSQDLDRASITKVLTRARNEMKNIKPDLEIALAEKTKIAREAATITEKVRKEKKQKILDFIEGNKKIIRACIKSYRGGIGNYMPALPDDKKETWNDAIEKFIENSNSYTDICYTELQFE